MSPPFIDGRSGVIETGEPAQVEAVIPGLAVEALDESVLSWLSWPDEVQFHTRLPRPEEHSLARQFGAIIADDRPGQVTVVAELTRQALPGDRQINDLQGAFAREVIDDVEHAEATAIGQLVGDEVQGPALVGRVRTAIGIVGRCSFLRRLVGTCRPFSRYSR